MTGQQVLELLKQRDDGELMRLIKTCASSHHVTVGELLGRDRRSGPCQARQAFWAALEATGHWSHGRIAEVVGRPRDTVRWGIAEHKRRTAAERPVGKAWMSCEETGRQ